MPEDIRAETSSYGYARIHTVVNGALIKHLEGLPESERQKLGFQGRAILLQLRKDFGVDWTAFAVD